MTFLYPTFLWALAAISVPVIIHLFNFRKYKKVYFTNVRFLRELQIESKSRSRLRELLVLLCRCLTIAALVLAFSQPVIRNKGAVQAPGANSVSIYIDNSFSMENVGRQGPLFQMAKAQAKEIVKRYGSIDRFQIITNDFEGKHQRLNTQEDALRIIEELKISPVERRGPDVFRRQSDFLIGNGTSKRKIFMLTDGQRSTFDLEQFPSDTLIPLTILTLPANQVNNVYIDSCWFETPLQQKGMIQVLHARIINSGGSDLEAGSARLTLNDRQIALASFSAQAGAGAEIKFTFDNKKDGFNFGSVRIEDYPITFDDELFLAFNSQVRLPVIVINGKNVTSAGGFTSLFSSDSLFEPRIFDEQTIDFNAFKTAQIIVLNQLSTMTSGLISELLKFSNSGGALAVIPGYSVEGYQEGFAALGIPAPGTMDTIPQKMERIEYASGFFKGVFEKVDPRVNLPVVRRHYKSATSTRSDLEVLLSLQNGDPFLSRKKLNNCSVFLFSSPLDETAGNFIKHALFVPTFYQISFASQHAVPLYYSSGTNVVIPLKNQQLANKNPPRIQNPRTSAELIPEIRVINNAPVLYTRGQITEPGPYQVLLDEKAVMPLAFNYPRSESRLDFYSQEEIENLVSKKGWKHVKLINASDADMSAAAMLETDGRKLWKLFIFLALGFIILELIFLRFLK